MPGRIDYLDTYKGILIIVVIFHHISFQIDVAGINDSVRSFNMILLPTYCSWFMPAFFLITGYCSNFNKPFPTFLSSQLRTLLWPSFTFFLIIHLFRSAILNDFTVFINSFSLIPIMGFNWFLTALFISKILYYGIVRIWGNSSYRFISLLFLAFCAIYMNDINLFGENYLHHRHALYLSFFLCTGHLIKELQGAKLIKYIQIFAYLFLPIVLLAMKINGVLPGIAGIWINFSMIQVPFHMLTAITGSCFILIIAQLVSKSKKSQFVNYVGINSLLFYLVHIDILRGTMLFASHFLNPSSLLQVVCFDILIILLTLFICSMLVYIFNRKYLRLLVKFPEIK